MPSLWFRAWRCKCSDRENDLPQDGKLQLNFFFRSAEYFELPVEAEEMEADLELVAGMIAIFYLWSLVISCLCR